MVFAVIQVRCEEVFEFFEDVVSVGVRVSGLSWFVVELVAVHLATNLAAPMPNLALFWNFFHKRYDQRLFFHTF